MSQQEIEKLEKLVESYKKSLVFAKEVKNKIRQSKYKYSIRETELRIKELEKKRPHETIARLQKIDSELTAKIEHLKEENEFLIAEFDEPLKTIDRLLNPEPELELEPEPIIEPEIILEPEDDNLVISELLYSTPEPEPLSEVVPEQIPEPEKQESETVENELIPCQYCGKMVKGERGLRVHQSQWCSKINEEVEVHE